MQGKFLGDTKGNRDLPVNRTTGGGGSHSPAGAGGNSKFLGHTKGNRDLPINRTTGGAGK